MGQARLRGTLEQRQAEAEQREIEFNMKRKEHLHKLDELEKKSQYMAEEGVRQLVNSFLKTTEKYSLTQQQRGNIMYPS